MMIYYLTFQQNDGCSYKCFPLQKSRQIIVRQTDYSRFFVSLHIMRIANNHITTARSWNT